jgi:hypothetical protein
MDLVNLYKEEFSSQEEEFFSQEEEFFFTIFISKTKFFLKTKKI